MKRKMIFQFLAFTVCLVLCGCGSRTVDEMYSIPRRSSEYKNLQSVIDASMNDMSYAAPVSGDNRQSVQMTDLDGDGLDEYLVYAKGNTENPLYILIFHQIDNNRYELMEALSCKGATFEQVQYENFDGKPGCEIIVGRQINDSVTRIASVYSFASGQSEQILSAIYSKCIACDLDGNGLAELMVIRNGEAEVSNAVAVLYRYNNGGIERSMEAPLSEKAEHIRRITLNKLSDGQPAVYVASASNDSTVKTDIFAMNADAFLNMSIQGNLGTSVQTLHNYYVYAQDIDNDGILELPMLEPMRFMSSEEDSTEQKMIRWFNINADGTETDKMYTFHNFAGGWYLKLNAAWVDRIAVEENGNINTFYMWNENYGEAMAVFSIYALTDKDRDIEAGTQNRFALYRGENVVYAAKLESASAMYGIIDEYLVNNFYLIHQEWTNGET